MGWGSLRDSLAGAMWVMTAGGDPSQAGFLQENLQENTVGIAPRFDLIY